MAKEIFISYSRKDFAKVKPIKDAIDKELGIECWMDLDGIESGQQFEDVIISAINQHDTILFMLSPNSMKSEWALDELDFAKRKNKRIVILYIESCEMTDKFYFRYHKYDSIEWHNILQREKLMTNFHSWFPHSKSHTSNSSSKISHYENQSIRVLAKEGNMEACHQLGGLIASLRAWKNKKQSFNIQTDDNENEKDLLNLAYNGDVEAQYKLGRLYNKNYMIPGNFEKAYTWYKKAAEQGHLEAMYRLGVCYDGGYGVEKNIPKAVEWYKKAAEEGNANAQYSYGISHFIGNGGLPKNVSIAVKWFKLSALQGNAVAQARLGMCYADGIGVEKDLQVAIKWYKLASLKGNAWALSKLAGCYYYGIGVREDRKEAIELYKKAAKNGDSYSINWLIKNGINY